jgi:hypoxanthine phosphoribosyltransferase
MPMPRTTAGTPSASPGDRIFELNWDLFGELCRALALKVSQSGYRPDLVVGIAKAGVIPGAVVAAMLRCEFYSMKISRRAGAEQVRSKPTILSAAPPQAMGKRVLIVDEICTSGTTLRMATSALRNVRAEETRTATVFVKVAKYRPDFYALETEGKVIFPWDRNVVNEYGDVVVNPMYEGLI